MSFDTSLGLTIQAYAPLVLAARSFLGEFGRQIDGWEHELAADGGYKSARFTLQLTVPEIEDWLEQGLMRHIECYNVDLEKIGEYFVNQLSANLGTIAITRGPVMNIVNRCSVGYTPILDVCATPPTTGTETVTVIANAADSQALYGILEEVVSGGTLMDDATDASTCGGATMNEAEALRDAYLEEHKWPESGEQINLESQTEISLSIECLGYGELLARYIYLTTDTGYDTLTAKIQAVLAADPNGLFSADYSQLATNAYLTHTEELTGRTAQAILAELVALGDVNNDRYIFGIYNERRAHYQPVPTTLGYVHRLGDKVPHIENLAGGAVYPWDVKPGRWCFLPDFMVGRTLPSSDFRLDPRYIFIERVQYVAPFGLTLEGSKVGRLAQLLAKKGMT